MKREEAEKIMKENRVSYNTMAQEFSRTRTYFWEELRFLAEHATGGMQVLDVGCGNGRFYDVLSERGIIYTGIDNSEGLLQEAQKLHPDAIFIYADATKLPFEDETFDIVYSFAVIHHIPGRMFRKQFINEMRRVLKPGGTLILTAWHLWQPRYITRILLSSMKSIFFLTSLDMGDFIHTFGKEKHMRFLHAFTIKSLERLLKKNGFLIAGNEIIERGGKSRAKNMVFVCKKKI